jgi:hypothetical protein
VAFEALEREGIAAARGRLLPPEVLVSGLARFEATAGEADDFVHGRLMQRDGGEVGAEVAVFAPGGAFLGVGLCDAPARVAPLRLMATASAKLPDFA